MVYKLGQMLIFLINVTTKPINKNNFLSKINKIIQKNQMYYTQHQSLNLWQLLFLPKTKLLDIFTKMG